MKTIQMTLDEDLIKEVDKEVKKLGTTRSAFTREALKKILTYYHELELEKKQIEGYKKDPIKSGEFSDWETEQIWIE
jgi:metal-responsive CopG/Arc/MetJ family transcriptional regulator